MSLSRPGEESESIVVLVVYFGRWPAWFPLYLDGCRRNPTIDFLFITDCGEHESIESLPNCRVQSTTLDEVARVAAERCSTDVNIPAAYKLCDLKPAYGDIFADLIEGYDYWGWTDIDVVYGDLRKFSEGLSEYDCFFVNRLWVSGVFALMRNSESVRRLYRSSRDWRAAFAEPKNVCFDECAWLWGKLKENPDILAHETVLDSFTHVVRRMGRRGEVRCRFNQLVHERNPQLIHADGSITEQDGTEYILFHFVTAKSRLLFVYPDWVDVPGVYWIGRHGFHRGLHSQARRVAGLLRPSAVRQILASGWRKSRKAVRMVLRGQSGSVVRDMRRRIASWRH